MEIKLKKSGSQNDLSGQVRNIREEIAGMRKKLDELNDEMNNFVNTLEQTKSNLNFNIDSKKYRETKENEISTLQISN